MVIIILIILIMSGESVTQNRKEHDARHRQETHLQALRVAMGSTHGQAKVLSGLQVK
jgi:hypothetical protein